MDINHLMELEGLFLRPESSNTWIYDILNIYSRKPPPPAIFVKLVHTNYSSSIKCTINDTL